MQKLLVKASSLKSSEDWWAVWLGLIFLGLIISGIIPRVPEILEWRTSLLQAIPLSELSAIIIWGIGLFLIWSVAVKIMKNSLKQYSKGFALLFGIALLAFLMEANVFIDRIGFGYVLWAVIIGLIISNFLGLPSWLKNAAKTELYIKTGLVLLGAEILFPRLAVFGAYGMGVAWLVTPIVLIFMFYFGMRIIKGLSSSLGITIAAATSVCGVSAAIATAQASRARKDELTLALGITMVFTAVMMFLLPFILNLVGMDTLVAGALIGGTIDATGAVVVASSILGEDALHVAATIKMVQNVLIGFLAFGVAVAWTVRDKNEGVPADKDVLEENKNQGRAKDIWDRFPKFIIGFIFASLIFSFVLLPAWGETQVEGLLSLVSSTRSWFFALAFVSIGLDTNFVSLRKVFQGGKPVAFYMFGQALNIILTLGAAYLFFSGRIFPPPM